MIAVDASDLIGAGDWLDQQLLDVTNKLALDIQRNLRVATPVDTGRARAGWEVERATAVGQAAVVLNPVEYIEPLIDGHSKQAPSGWFANAITAAVVFGGDRDES